MQKMVPIDELTENLRQQNSVEEEEEMKEGTACATNKFKK